MGTMGTVIGVIFIILAFAHAVFGKDDGDKGRRRRNKDDYGGYPPSHYR
jgi:hypothetical protein